MPMGNEHVVYVGHGSSYRSHLSLQPTCDSPCILWLCCLPSWTSTWSGTQTTRKVRRSRGGCSITSTAHRMSVSSVELSRCTPVPLRGQTPRTPHDRCLSRLHCRMGSPPPVSPWWSRSSAAVSLELPKLPHRGGASIWPESGLLLTRQSRSASSQYGSRATSKAGWGTSWATSKPWIMPVPKIPECYAGNSRSRSHS